MIKIELLPLAGIAIEGIGKIYPGQTKPDVELLLGQPGERSHAKQFYYDNYEFRIDFDQQDCVEFIEFIYGPFPEKTILSLYGIDPFQIGAANLVQLLTGKNNGPVDDSEADFGFAFLNISVGLWRQIKENDVLESIAEMKAAGTYEENKVWLEEDLLKAKNFWTIGIGGENYYRY